MMTAGILAKQTDVPLYTVRHYTRIGLLRPSRHPGNGYKVYHPSDAAKLRFIKSAKALGFTLTEIAQFLDEAKHGKSPCPMVREIIVRHIAENRRKIKELQLLQKKMENSLKDWEQLEDSMPNGESVCHLIESVTEIENRA
jgi:MerR family Zn(II)-responsive transcriptional regulator of zntA